MCHPRPAYFFLGPFLTPRPLNPWSRRAPPKNATRLRSFSLVDGRRYFGGHSGCGRECPVCCSGGQNTVSVCERCRRRYCSEFPKAGCGCCLGRGLKSSVLGGGDIVDLAALLQRWGGSVFGWVCRRPCSASALRVCKVALPLATHLPTLTLRAPLPSHPTLPLRPLLFRRAAGRSPGRCGCRRTG